MHVFLTGATGFVGHHVLRALRRAGHTVRCLVRPGSIDKLPVDPNHVAYVDSSKAQIVAGEAPAGTGTPEAKVEVVYGDVTDLASIEGDLAGCDAVIHLVGIIEENRPKGVTFERIHVRGTRTVVEQAKAAGVGRFVHMSANGARPDAEASRYHRTKHQAEEAVRAAGFERAVIFRPSIIFGDPGAERIEFASRLADTLVRPFPVLPVLGDGEYELQPVHVDAVAEAFVQALALEPPAEGEPVRTFCVGGPERLSFNEVLDRIARGMGKEPKPKVHQPLWMAKALVGTLGEVGLLPITPAQFQMLVEGNTCDDDAFDRAFDVEQTPFTPEHLGYLR
ncbi:MAG: NAD-dependent epimerase/dehydratase family protein [Rhodothermales bacterium]|nr:NAD-dependent epimerase/dehydratase family protein [Rhodothermales bacterium]